MALRWTAAAVPEREKRFRHITGWRDLGLLGARLTGTTRLMDTARR